jgi:hypothetical protein
MFKIVCAWCGKHLHGSETADEISHGICEACQATAVADCPVAVADQCETGEGRQSMTLEH